MRLWSIHPKYLDAQGLVALWREALLAQKVLCGKTKGYRRHPQLKRFSSRKDPIAAIGSFLMKVYQEAQNRGYSFNKRKIISNRLHGKIGVKKGQLLYEFEHLKSKLRKRSPKDYRRIVCVLNPSCSSAFKKIPGSVENWEKQKTYKKVKSN